MTPFNSLISGMTKDGDSHRVNVTDDWLQGRTAYGGLAGALCLASALDAFADLPPLRSAQIMFAGPASGELTLTPALLRKGKSTVFAEVGLSGEAGLATRANFCFGAARASSLNYGTIAPPKVPSPDDSEPFFRNVPGLNFVQHFDGRLAAGSFPMSRAPEPTMTLWLRHRDEKARTGATALVALADAPPPAAIVLFEKFAPISTMTWTADFLTDDLSTTDGWWLVQTTAETIADGYSSQAMTIWNADGRPVMVARQNIAVFI